MWSYQFVKSNQNSSSAPVNVFTNKNEFDVHRITCRAKFMKTENKKQNTHFQKSDAGDFKINVNMWGSRACEYVTYTPTGGGNRLHPRNLY